MLLLLQGTLSKLQLRFIHRGRVGRAPFAGPWEHPCVRLWLSLNICEGQVLTPQSTWDPRACPVPSDPVSVITSPCWRHHDLVYPHFVRTMVFSLQVEDSGKV